MYKNVAFITCPSTEVNRPPAAAAALAAIMVKNKCNYRIYDLVLNLYDSLSPDDWFMCENRWKVNQDQELPETFFTWLNLTVDTIVTEGHDLVAISVFSKYSTRFAEILLKHLRPKIDVTIIIGGGGIWTPWGDDTFARLIYDQKLVDYVFRGDGEEQLNNFLNGIDHGPGINFEPFEQLKNLDDLPFPVYDQIEPKNYHYENYHEEPGIYVTASRGCVRKCKFCDVNSRWPKYRYRKGANITEEIYTAYKNTGIKIVQFTDSVLNGYIPEFKKLQESLIEYHKKDSNFKIKYYTQFNIRKKEEMTEELYRLMAKAGADILITGVEHASERIRFEMGKEFDDEDLKHHTRMCAKYGIRNIFLMFIGYPTETIEDHQKMLDFLEEYQVYALSNTISVIRLGFTGSLDKGTKLELKTIDNITIKPEFPDLKFMVMDDQNLDWIYGRNWINLNNPSLTFRERIRRRLEINERCLELGYPIIKAKEELEIIKMMCEAFYNPSSIKQLRISDSGDH